MLELYELCGDERERLFSPYTWRVRLTLGIKDLPFQSRPTRFTEIPTILDGSHSKVPVLVDGDLVVRESFNICAHLEAAYHDTVTVFGGDGTASYAALIDNVIVTSLYPTLSRIIIKDIHSQLTDTDQAYFRETREKRFGHTLEDVQRGRDKEREKLHTFLKPYRRRLDEAPFLGGDRLLFADIALAASFCWAKATSSYDIFAGDEVWAVWFDRVLGAAGQHDALKLAS